MTKDWSPKPVWALGAFEDAIDVSVVAHLRHEYGAADSAVLVKLTQRIVDKGRVLQVIANDLERAGFSELRNAARDLRIAADVVGAMELVQLGADFEQAATDADATRARELRRTSSAVLLRARFALLRLVLSARPSLPV